MGISGGLFKSHEDGSAYIHKFAMHDSAAVLLDDGKVVSALEEERINRIKHTNKIPLGAIRACLNSNAMTLADLDYLAYYCQENRMNSLLMGLNMKRTLENERFEDCWDVKTLLRNIFSREFEYDLPAEKIIFVSHHFAHALSAFIPSGFDESLVITIDGQGDNESGRVFVAKGSSLEALKVFPVAQSLGNAYGNLINLIGFQQFEEYKVMGLAPYGDSTRYRDLLKELYSLLPDGDYKFNYEKWQSLYSTIRPRKKQEEITQDHMDMAAALQGAVEEIVFHLLTHYREATGQRNLTLAGGVAHNCTINGKILSSGMFDQVFVQPAAHDAGCAYGAALSVFLDKKPDTKMAPLQHLYWGTDVGGDEDVLAALTPWQRFISIEKVSDVCGSAANLIADGNVIGWVQGRSEFGPRALGNRSILADPRPAINKEIINAMVKKREAFRPFAPSVLQERAEEFFEVTGDMKWLSYMIFVVKVRPEKRDLLGAVTHIDGTARIQTVAREVNERYWSLIAAFADITGVPVLLNTSFNNNVEPIVDTVEDAVACFLTTRLQYLAVGNYLVSKKNVNSADYLDLIPSLPRHIMIYQVKRADVDGNPAVFFEAKNNFDPSFKAPVSAGGFDILVRASGQDSLSELIDSSNLAGGHNLEQLSQEMHDLWSQRIIALKPRANGLKKG
jgi:carbamoyltransferase